MYSRKPVITFNDLHPTYLSRTLRAGTDFTNFLINWAEDKNTWNIGVIVVFDTIFNTLFAFTTIPSDETLVASIGRTPTFWGLGIRDMMIFWVGVCVSFSLTHVWNKMCCVCWFPDGDGSLRVFLLISRRNWLQSWSINPFPLS